MTGRRRANGEGSVYFDHSKNRWIGSVRVGNSRRKVTGRTKTETRQRLDVLRAEALRGNGIGNGNLTVAEVLDKWQTRTLTARNVSQTTRDSYSWCVKCLVDELGSKRVERLTVETVERTLDALAEGSSRRSPLKRSSLVKVRSVLSQALDSAIRRGQVSRNVARLAELPPNAERGKERRALTAVEARELIKALEGERLKALYLLMLTIGLRPGEATALRWEDIDFAAGRVAIRSGVRIERGRPVLVDELKTRRSRRTIDLPPIVLSALHDHRRAQVEERLAAPYWVYESIVFASAHGTLLEPRTIRRTLQRVLETAGIKEITPNELRHSAASLLSAAGVPLEYIADLLGHTNTRMLEMTYRHSVQPSVSVAVAPMQQLLASGQ